MMAKALSPKVRSPVSINKSSKISYYRRNFDNKSIKVPRVSVKPK